MALRLSSDGSPAFPLENKLPRPLGLSHLPDEDAAWRTLAGAEERALLAPAVRQGE